MKMFVVATSEDSARSWAEDGLGLILKKEQAQERAALLNGYPEMIDHQLVFEVELEIEVHSVTEVLRETRPRSRPRRRARL